MPVSYTHLDVYKRQIPDTVKTGNYQKRSFTWYMEKPSAKDYFLTVFIFAVCTLIGLLFQKLDFTDTNIVTIYILGVLLTSIVTDGYLCSVAGSFLDVYKRQDVEHLKYIHSGTLSENNKSCLLYTSCTSYSSSGSHDRGSAAGNSLHSGGSPAFEPCSDQLHVRSSHIQYADLPEE